MNTVLIGRIDEITQLINEAERTISFLENKVEKYTSKSSEYLLGIIGGILGGFGFVGLGVSKEIFKLEFTNDLIMLLVAFGVIFGCVMFIVLWRWIGIRLFKLERLTKKTYLIKGNLISEMNLLPTNTPQYIKDELWDSYNNVSETYQQKAIETLIR